MKRVRVGNAWYIVAEDPVDMTKGPEDETPSAQEVVEEVEEEPSAEWRETYLPAIFKMIRNQFDLKKGQVVILGPGKSTEYVSDAYGFDITGHLRFEDFEPDQGKYGAPPYSFKINVNPEGALSKLVLIEGQPLD